MDYIAFGELLMRLNPQGYKRLRNCSTLEVSYGGAEANVMAALANFGLNTRFVTKLAKNELSIAAVNQLRAHGIDVSGIVYGGDRLGIYFVEKGASYRQSKVVYDRKNSSICLAKKDEFNWDKLLDGCCLFYTTGISAAISESCADITLSALKSAKNKGVTCAFDINYRQSMWDFERAKKVLYEMCKQVDILISNEEHLRLIFGITADPGFYNGSQLSNQGYADIAKKAAIKFGCSAVALTMRNGDTADFNKWGAMLYTKSGSYFSPVYDIQIKERIGAGDAFAAGLIYALTNNYLGQDAINFAAGCTVLKHTIELDFLEAGLDEVLAFVKSGGASRVLR